MGILGLFRKAGTRSQAPETVRETEAERESQCKLILDVLREGVSLTQSDAIYLFNCYRLSARIWDLRHKDKWGHPDIRSERKGRGSFVRYYIPTEGE